MTLDKLNEIVKRGPVTGSHPRYGVITLKETTVGGIWFTGEKRSYHYDVDSLQDFVADSAPVESVEKPGKKKRDQDKSDD